jgi:hypothetical protein
VDLLGADMYRLIARLLPKRTQARCLDAYREYQRYFVRMDGLHSAPGLMAQIGEWC